MSGELERASEAAGSMAREMGAMLVRDLQRPEFRAGLGTALLSTAVLARTRLPFIAVFAISLMAGASVEHLYGMAMDIHEKLTGDAPGEV